MLLGKLQDKALPPESVALAIVEMHKKKEDLEKGKKWNKNKESTATIREFDCCNLYGDPQIILYWDKQTNKTNKQKNTKNNPPTE